MTLCGFLFCVLDLGGSYHTKKPPQNSAYSRFWQVGLKDAGSRELAALPLCPHAPASEGGRLPVSCTHFSSLVLPVLQLKECAGTHHLCCLQAALPSDTGSTIKRSNSHAVQLSGTSPEVTGVALSTST